MTAFEYFQNKLLKKLGYDVAPFEGDYDSKFVSLEDGKFHFMDGDAEDSYRELDNIKGDILLRLDDDGYHVCPFISEDGKPIKYTPKLYKYFILRSDNRYTELEYLDDMNLSDSDTFEVVETKKYIAIKYNKKWMDEPKRLKEKPLLNSIIVKEKDITHLGVFTYCYEDKIVVYGIKNDDEEIEEEIGLIVYDKDFNTLYKRTFSSADSENFEIWEYDGKSCLLFPHSGSVYDLSESKMIRLYGNEGKWWQFTKTYKDIFLFYTETPFVNEPDGGRQLFKAPVKSTEGQVFDSHFKLLREFSIVGEIEAIKEVGDSTVIEGLSVTKNNLSISRFYDVKGTNVTYREEGSNEAYSEPDMLFKDMGIGSLYIVQTRVNTSDIIDFGNNKDSNFHAKKCGVYYRAGVFGEKYKKLVDFKYDYIKPLPLKCDGNAYYVGVNGRESNNICDFYVDDKLLFRSIPFNRGRAVKVMKNGYFIEINDAVGQNHIFRKGKIVFTTRYEIKGVYLKKECDAWGRTIEDDSEFLIVVKDSDLYGIYSPTGKMVLPIEYSTIDIDEDLTIVLGKKDNNEKELIGDIRFGEYMYVGEYIKADDYIACRGARVIEDQVILGTYYYWNDGFVDTCEDDDEDDGNPSPWENYTIEDSLYDALGGEMDAIWNID